MGGTTCEVDGQDLRTTAYCQLAVCSVIWYDYLTTLSKEIQSCWTGRTSSSILFLLNRYALLAYGVVVLVKTFPCSSRKGSGSIGISYEALQLVLFTISAVFTALRTHAITGLRLSIALPVLVLGLFPVAVTLYAVISQTYAPLFCDPSVCAQLDAPPHLYRRKSLSYQALNAHRVYTVIIAARTCAIISELIALVATYHHTNGWQMNSISGHHLIFTFTRWGTIYFIFMLVLNILQMTVTISRTCELPVLYDFCYSVGYPTYFIAPAGSILTSHFILELRRSSTREHSDNTLRTVSFVSAGHQGPSTVGFKPRPFQDLSCTKVDNLANDSYLYGAVFDISSPTEGVPPYLNDAQSITTKPSCQTLVGDAEPIKDRVAQCVSIPNRSAGETWLDYPSPICYTIDEGLHYDEWDDETEEVWLDGEDDDMRLGRGV